MAVAADPHAPPARMVGIGWLIVAVCLLAVSAWLLSYPAGFPFGLLVPGLLMLLAWGCVVVLWLVAATLFVARSITKARQRTSFSVLVAGAFVIGAGAALFAGAALRLRFELSESELERLAERFVEAPKTVRGGRAGLYDIKWVGEGSGGSVVLVTHDCGLGDCGFAYAPRGAPPEVCEDSDYQVYSHLAGPWYEAGLYVSGPCG